MTLKLCVIHITLNKLHISIKNEARITYEIKLNRSHQSNQLQLISPNAHYLFDTQTNCINYIILLMNAASINKTDASLVRICRTSEN